MRIAIAGALAFCVLATVQAQPPGQTTIRGSVRGPSGETLPGINIDLLLKGTPVRLIAQTTTNAAGEYQFVVRRGDYFVQVRAVGYSTAIRDLELSILTGTTAPVILEKVSEAAPATDQKYTPVLVYFATDRKATTSSQPGARYGNERGDAVEFGTAVVSIPQSHRLANLEGPTWFKPQDPATAVIVMQVSPRSEPEFFNLIGQDLSKSRRDILLFVHGYNVTFSNALRRTAQLAYDLQWKGPAITYTWPSGGSVPDYVAAEAVVDVSKYRLEPFLRSLLAVGRQSKAQIHTVGHSMGNRLLSRALERIAPSSPRAFEHIALTAPDIDEGEFRKLAGALAASSRNVTMYVSADDRALLVSQGLHQFPRVGLERNVYAGIDTVDATGVDMSLIRHSYFGESSSVVRDLFQLMRCRLPVDKRSGLAASAPSDPRFWRFIEKTVDQNEMKRLGCPV